MLTWVVGLPSRNYLKDLRLKTTLGYMDIVSLSGRKTDLLRFMHANTDLVCSKLYILRFEEYEDRCKNWLGVCRPSSIEALEPEGLPLADIFYRSLGLLALLLGTNGDLG